MSPSLLRTALRSPLPAIADGLRFRARFGARVARARLLCDCADGLRLRRPRNWQARSQRLYRRSTQVLGDLAGPAAADADAAVTAHTALRAATAPSRRGLAGLTRALAGVMVVAVLGTGLVALVSPTARARLFPRDLAAGRPWTASSADLGLPASGAGPSSEENLFFHTREEQQPFVELDLGGEYVVRAVRVENRVDCCQERALPLNVEIWDGSGWQLVAQRRTAFKVWRYDVGPVRTSKVRFLRPGYGYFHLRRVSVYGQ
jgi:hypothetical protein